MKKKSRKSKNMLVRFKKMVPEAVAPTRAHQSDAGLDLTAIGKDFDRLGNVVYHTGIAVEIPQGHVGLVFPRSSVCRKAQMLTNSVGVIDSGYRGEITMKFKPQTCYGRHQEEYVVGERIGQLIIMPYPEIEFVEVDELDFGERGESGYGSSGK